MLTYWLEIFSEAVARSLKAVDWRWIALAFVLSGWLFAWSKKGSANLKADIDTFVSALPGPILVWLLVLAWFLAHIPYTDYRNQQQVAQDNTVLNSTLERRLAEKRQSLDSTDPAFHNMLGTIRAFMDYRRAIGPDARCHFLITASEDAQRLAGLVTQFAVVGGNCPNGNLQNLGIKPQDVRKVEQTGMIPGKAVLHALPDTHGVEQLKDALSSLFQIERSYEMPVPPESVPPNVIWLHFGTGAKWNTELVAR